MLDPSPVVSKRFGSHVNRCSECKSTFRPHPRLKDRQKTCTKKTCQLSYRARYRKRYRRKNLQTETDSQAKTKSNRAPDYWKKYRAKNPSSSARNRAQTRLRKQLRQLGLQRQLDILQVFDPPGYFDLYQRFATSHRSLLLACQATRAA